MSLKETLLPHRYNYIAAFLTLDCNLGCGYCINKHGSDATTKTPIISGKKWIEMLNRIDCPENLPVTLQGGEPSLHPDFVGIINGLREDLKLDILTNLTFDVGDFISKINPERLKRDAPYPSIRVSYHAGNMDLDCTINNSIELQEAGFDVGIFMIRYPWDCGAVEEAEGKCRKAGLTFKTKEYLGKFHNKVYGTYSHPEGISSATRRRCLCRTSELIIGPSGHIFRCHHDLYKNFSPTGNMLDYDLEIRDIFRECSRFGDCNPCDLKIKTNRFQVYGYSSVEIEGIEWRAYNKTPAKTR